MMQQGVQGLGMQAALGAQAAAVNAYGQQPRKPSLLTDSGRLIERLIEISARAERSADMLCGHAPTPINNVGDAKQQGGAPADANLQFNLDTASRWIERIEMSLSRIEGGL